jgi:hypothetical protein
MCESFGQQCSRATISACVFPRCTCFVHHPCVITPLARLLRDAASISYRKITKVCNTTVTLREVQSHGESRRHCCIMNAGVRFGAVTARLSVLCAYDSFNHSGRSETLGRMGSGRSEQRNYLLHRIEDFAMGLYSGQSVLSRALCCQPQSLAQSGDLLTTRLSERLFGLGEPVGPLQYFAWLGTIRGSHDPVSLH